MDHGGHVLGFVESRRDGDDARPLRQRRHAFPVEPLLPERLDQEADAPLVHVGD